MGAYVREHGIYIHLEELEGMAAADRDIEVDFALRSVGLPFEREACEGWWLWR